jgi:hypothetical protein
VFVERVSAAQERRPTTGDDRAMQYLLFVIDDTTNSGTPEEQAAIDVFNDRLEAEAIVTGGSKAGNRRIEVRPFR